MAAVPDIDAIRKLILAGLQASLTDYYIGDVPGEATDMIDDYEKFANLFLAQGTINEANSSIPTHFAFDVTWNLVASARADSDAEQDHALDLMINEILDACNSPGQGFPPFGSLNIILAYVTSFVKVEDEDEGIFWQINLYTLIK
jgi:hypothetical protein